jgi:hypothetical protein
LSRWDGIKIPGTGGGFSKKKPQIPQIDTDYKKNKKISVICVICGHLFFIDD